MGENVSPPENDSVDQALDHAAENGTSEKEFEDDIPFGKPDPEEPVETAESEEEKPISELSNAQIAKGKKKAIEGYEKRKKKKAKNLNLTDIGNSELFSRAYSHKMVYCGQWNTWLVWNGKKWRDDMTGQIVEWAKECMKRLYEKAFDERDPELRDWAFRSASKSKIDAFIKLAHSEPGIPREPKDFDSLPMIINLDNGIYDLKENRLELQLSDKYCSKLAGVYYDKDAECDLWCDFLDRIMDSNSDLIAFLQRAVGYSLSGDTREQCFFVLQGPGANGKSTFVNTILSLVGDYGAQLRSETIAAYRLGQIPTDIARMPGKRFVSVQETPQGCRLNESLMKQLTGGDRITARGLYQKEFEYTPQFKIWLSTNHKPRITGRDLAIWRRIHLIPFNVIIPEPEQDKELGAKLLEELPGILNWAIEGYRSWREYGLIVPEEVQAATNEYRTDEDILADFIAEKCERPGKVQSSILYNIYETWAEENGEKKKSNRWLTLRLKERGFLVEQETSGENKGKMFWQDLGLKKTER